MTLPIKTKKRATPLRIEERRQQIIAATIPMLAVHGDSLTSAQIAKAAGIAEGTIFRAFQDKDSLLLASFEHVALPEKTCRLLAGLSLDLGLEKVVTNIIELTLEHFRKSLPIMHAVGQTKTNQPRIQKTIGAMFGGLLQQISVILEQFVKDNHLHGNPEILSQFIVGQCQAAVWRERFEHRSMVAAGDIARIFLYGCATTNKQTLH